MPVVPALALIVLLAGPSPAEPNQAPAVDLRRISFTRNGAEAPLSGSSGRARLTLDSALQRTASRLLARANPIAGAVVAVDAPTGRVLVWAERRPSASQPGAVLLDTQAPAASLFKIVTSAALLEKAGIGPATRVCTNGGLHSIERQHLEPPARGDSARCGSFAQALGHSRNAVFAQLATRHLLRADLQEMADQFGFNGPLPFVGGPPMGAANLPYNDLEFARAAAGFIGSELSPLGALNLAYVVAAGGQAVRLEVVAKAGEYRAPERRRVVGRVMSAWTAQQIRRMMEVTVHSGTSLDAFSDPKGQSYLGGIRVAGKTGTLRPSATAPTTSWFVGFAPSRRPRIVVSVLIQNGKVWRRKANEVARDVLRAYFADHGWRGVTHPLPSARASSQ